MSEITLIAALELTSNSASERRWGGGRILQVWVESEWSAECRAGDRVGGGDDTGQTHTRRLQGTTDKIAESIN